VDNAQDPYAKVLTHKDDHFVPVHLLQAASPDRGPFAAQQGEVRRYRCLRGQFLLLAVEAI